MAMNSQTIERFEKQRQVLDAIYRLLPVGEQVRDFAAGDQIEAEAGTGPQSRRYVAEFVDLGILDREGPEYGSPANGMTPGRHYHYTLLVPYDEASRILAEYQDKELREIDERRTAGHAKATATKRNNNITLASADSNEDTRAIVGPEPEAGIGSHVSAEALGNLRTLRKDEAGALVEAARQYGNRGNTLNTQIDAFEQMAKELGVSFDRDVMLRSLSVERDERLEHIALVLPFIDGLEKQILGLTNSNEAMRQKVKDFDQLDRDYKALRKMWEARFSQSVSSSTIATQ